MLRRDSLLGPLFRPKRSHLSFASKAPLSGLRRLFQAKFRRHSGQKLSEQVYQL
ncbi:hypothetical protein Hanom_Chr04g00291101 [Helianthus anomalus]